MKADLLHGTPVKDHKEADASDHPESYYEVREIERGGNGSVHGGSSDEGLAACASSSRIPLVQSEWGAHGRTGRHMS
jgi:hypothetical protein